MWMFLWNGILNNLKTYFKPMKITNKKAEIADRKGNTQKGRIISVTSTFDCPPENIWGKLQNVDTLIEICKPKASFKSISEIPEKWEKNIIYKFKLFIYGFIPVGTHEIRLVDVNESKKEILSEEHNSVVKVWNHLISMAEIEGNRTLYTDVVELNAGIFTYFTALWSISFYKHRQRKWRKIIQQIRPCISV